MEKQEERAVPAPYDAAEALEQHLGDPANPENVLSWKACMELDEREAYPVEACAALTACDFPAFLVPAAEGGVPHVRLQRGQALRTFPPTLVARHAEGLYGSRGVFLVQEKPAETGGASVMRTLASAGVVDLDNRAGSASNLR